MGVVTWPLRSTKGWPPLMTMFVVGTTKTMGDSLGYPSGSHTTTGMLYLLPCRSRMVKQNRTWAVCFHRGMEL